MSRAPAGASLQALLDRGDEFARAGDPKAAMSFYQRALQGARTMPLDGPSMERLRAAQAFIQNQANEFQGSLDGALASFEPENDVAKIRLNHALEMMAGKRAIELQQPSVLYYPYLAQRQFFERDEFGWAAKLEAVSPIIRGELLNLLNDGADFRPYVQDDPNRPTRDFHGLNNSRSWTALYLWRNAALVPEIADRCPQTVEAFAQVPLTHIGRRTPSVFFSRLEAAAHIPPHHGLLNCRLICHLPLIVPPGCWLRVGNETRQWEDGKLLIFDDSMEHEAKNPTGHLRIVLIFDIWRPELTEAERAAISTIFDAIDSFQGLPDA